MSALILLAWGAQAQAKAEYVGDDKCKMCHNDIYETYIKTGHPYKIQKINGGPPSYPPGTSPGVPNPPKGMSWDDVTYVIGGYGWKARFMDTEGYILTGDKDRQYNLANADIDTETNWSGYSAKTAPRKPYDKCGTCHTTGWVKTGKDGPHQDGLPGIHGTFAQPGVRCEACHGPGSEHMANPGGVDMSKAENCGECHRRGDVTQIDAKGGLVRHHEQYEDLLASPHKDLACGTCHNPHKGVKYKQGGVKSSQETCLTCHANQTVKVKGKEKAECTSCHMPRIAKSAMAVKHQFKGGEVPEGDIRGHIFRINLDPEWSMFTDDGKLVRVDDQKKAYMTVEYTCLSCHNDKDKAWALDAGKKVHGG
jgi:hypothetical protein